MLCEKAWTRLSDNEMQSSPLEQSQPSCLQRSKAILWQGARYAVSERLYGHPFGRITCFLRFEVPLASFSRTSVLDITYLSSYSPLAAPVCHASCLPPLPCSCSHIKFPPFFARKVTLYGLMSAQILCTLAAHHLLDNYIYWFWLEAQQRNGNYALFTALVSYASDHISSSLKMVLRYAEPDQEEGCAAARRTKCC